MGLFKKIMPDWKVEMNYVKAGILFAKAILINCIEFELEKNLNLWEKWEEEYSKRGYKTISMEDFFEISKQEEKLYTLLNKRRAEGEEPIFHSKNFKYGYFLKKH